MYIQLISIHGLIRGEDIEMGRDSDTGGQVRYVLELARTLSTLDAVKRVDLFTRQIKDRRVGDDYSVGVEDIAPKARIVRLPCGGGKYLRKEKLWPFLDDYVDAMISFTRHEGLTPSVVHGHYADAGYIAREVASAFGVPFVFTGHSLGRDKLAYLLDEGVTREKANQDFNIDHRISVEESCLATADMVVTSTRHEIETQYARYDYGNEPSFQVIPPGTELSRFFPYYEYELNGENIDETYKQARMRMKDELARFHFQSDKPLILALCRPDRRKNINSLIQTYGENKQLQAVANLAVFAGIRGSIDELEESERAVLTDILLMMDKYDLYGKMAIPKRHDSQQEVPELYRLAASQRGVFVNTAFVEPFGLTFIESSAVGLPFVGTQNGGPQDIVANCESGIIVDVTDYKALGDAILQILTDAEMWKTFSANGINRVREFYTWETHCETYLEKVKALVNQPAKQVFNIGSDDKAPGRRLASVEKILITDIDNTLLGDDTAMEELLDLMHDNRDRVGFGVASGRHLKMVHEVLEEHKIQNLDVIVSSVGTEIYYGPNWMPDKGWASHLRSKWRPERVHEALDPLPFVTLQEDTETQREFKISYDLDDNVPPGEALPQIEAALSKVKAPYNLIFSHGCYIDILAPRASKGKALRHLSNKWNIPLPDFATSGDSGNDTDMLKGQTAGIVVGNYDPELEPLRTSTSRIYFAEAHYAAGIIEGLRHYEFI